MKKSLVLITGSFLAMQLPAYGFLCCGPAEFQKVHEAITAEGLNFLEPTILNGIITEDIEIDKNDFFASEPWNHFDNCFFKEGIDQINLRYEEVLEGFNPDHPDISKSIKAFGHLLHPLQDFYAHTNWVELGKTGLFDGGLHFLNPLSPYLLISDNVFILQGDAEPQAYTLARPSYFGSYPGNSIIEVTANSTGVKYFGLVSGLYDPLIGSQMDVCPDKENISMTHEDLNKDWPGASGREETHYIAKAIATRQTAHEWCRLTNLVKKTWGERGAELLAGWQTDEGPVMQACDDFAVDNSLAAEGFKSNLATGENGAFTLILRNNGPYVTTGMTITMGFTPTVSVQPVLGSTGCVVEGTAVNCKVDKLDLGETQTFSFSLRAEQAGRFTILATVYSNEVDLDGSNDKVRLEGVVNTPQYSLSVGKAIGGTIVGNQIDCGADCNEIYSEGSVVTLDAVPAPGYSFAGWSGDCIGKGSCILTMGSNKNIAASFTADAKPVFNLIVKKQGSGSGAVLGGAINCGGICSASVESGSTLTLTPTPAAGSFFKGWQGACQGQGTCSLSMNGDKEAVAVFETNTLPGGTLVKLTIQGPSTVDESSRANYRAEGEFSDSSKMDLTLQATWSINSTYGFISNSGELKADEVVGDRTISITAVVVLNNMYKSATMSVTIVNTVDRADLPTPSNVVAQLNPCRGSVILRWDYSWPRDLSITAMGFRIERRGADGDWRQIAENGSPFLDDATVASSEYSYRVRAWGYDNGAQVVYSEFGNSNSIRIPANALVFNPPQAFHSYQKISGSFEVSENSSCSYSPKSDNNWIIVGSLENSGTSKTLHYFVDYNRGLARQGSISISGKKFIINQEANPYYKETIVRWCNPYNRDAGLRVSWDPPDPSRLSSSQNGPFNLDYGQSFNLQAGECQNVKVSYTPDSPDPAFTRLYRYYVFHSSVQDVDRSTFQIVGSDAGITMAQEGVDFTFGEVPVGSSRETVVRWCNPFDRNAGLRVSWDPPDVSHLSNPDRGPFSLTYGQSFNLKSHECQNVAVRYSPQDERPYAATLYRYYVYKSAVRGADNSSFAVVGATPFTQNTAPGSNVPISPRDKVTEASPVTLTFESVFQAGSSSLETSNFGPPLPAGFSLGNPGIYYDVKTSANFSGKVEVCIDYGKGEYPPDTTLYLLHYNVDHWENVTSSSNRVANRICGDVSSLSPFVVAWRPDNSPPITRLSIPNYKNGSWSKNKVTLFFSSSDEGGSEIERICYSIKNGSDSKASCETAKSLVLNLGSEGENRIAYYAIDVAGNREAIRDTIIKIDTTPPQVVFMPPTPAPNAFGWNNSDVSMAYTASDALSGMDSSSLVANPIVITSEGADLVQVITVSDIAGNRAMFSSGRVKIDKTSPLIVVGPQIPLPNKYGWNNTDVSIEFQVTEGLSGLYQLTPPAKSIVFQMEGKGQSMEIFATDSAGNRAAASTRPVNIDKTVPSITILNQIPQPNRNGWNRTNVSFPFTSQDNLSGILSTDPAQSPITVSNEGTASFGIVRSEDSAGNSTTLETPKVNIDKTPPSLSCESSLKYIWPANHKMVPVSTFVSVADILSGPNGYLLIGSSSNEPDNGKGDGNTQMDIQGFSLGKPDNDGLLRAERAGGGAGRNYSLEYQGKDLADNVKSCTLIIQVQKP